MTTFQKFKVGLLKLSGLLLALLPTVYVIDKYFYKEQPAKIKISMTGIILLIVFAIVLLTVIRRYRNKKEIAHEVAKNLGQPSQSVNPVVLEFMNYITFSIPFVLIILVEDLLESYKYIGNPSKPFLLALFAISVGYIVRVIGVVLEQSYLRKGELIKIENNQNQIVEKLKSSMKQTDLK